MLDKYLDCRSNLEAYLWMNNVISDNNLDLNLYIVLTIYYVVVIPEVEVLKRSKKRISSWGSKRWF